MSALDKLNQMIPVDMAIANKALSVSLLGITNINTITLPKFAQAVAQVQTTAGLDLINSLTAPVHADAVTAITAKVSKGTGVNGTVLITDILGAATGAVSSQVLTNTIKIFATMDLTQLSDVYQRMYNTVTGVYGNPTGSVTVPAGVAAGVYANADVAFTTALIPAAKTIIATVTSTYPQQTAELNSLWSSIIAQLKSEVNLQNQAGINFSAFTANNTNSVYSFVLGLPVLGQKMNAGELGSYIQALADMSSLSGQSIIASLRQSQTNLSSMGIGVSSNIPST